jgi:hypothetical protein
MPLIELGARIRAVARDNRLARKALQDLLPCANLGRGAAAESRPCHFVAQIQSRDRATPEGLLWI